jgi:hypothetical protein
MAQLDSDLMDESVELSDEREAGLKLTSAAIRQCAIPELNEVLQMLGLKESPPPTDPSYRNEWGQAGKG